MRLISDRLWISGHTNEAFVYTVGRTRCLGNRTGFVGVKRHSGLFRPDRIVKLDIRDDSPSRENRTESMREGVVHSEIGKFGSRAISSLIALMWRGTSIVRGRSIGISYLTACQRKS